MGKLILNGVEYSTSGNLYNPVIYSDTERKIGVWRDNKPLYQRVWDFGSDLVIPNNSFYTTSIDSSNIETIIEGFGIYSTGATRYDLLANTNGTNIRLQADRTNGSANVRYLVLRYTKTTDSAGSGNWNTDGIPTHHYSTNEQVIGTWIDGKPLYEKTINYGTLPNVANVAKDVNHNIANVDKIWITEGFATNGTFVNQLNLSGVNNGEWYFGATSTYIRCVTQSDRSAYSAYVTIRYTKTTD